MLCKAGQLLSNLWYRLGNGEINEAICPGSQRSVSQTSANPALVILHITPQIPSWGEICMQLCFTETEQALAVEQPPRDQGWLHRQHHPDPRFQSCTHLVPHIYGEPSLPPSFGAAAFKFQLFPARASVQRGLAAVPGRCVAVAAPGTPTSRGLAQERAQRTGQSGGWDRLHGASQAGRMSWAAPERGASLAAWPSQAQARLAPGKGSR